MPIVTKDARWIYFELTSSVQDLTEDICRGHQAACGFHPFGYGFYKLKIVDGKDGKKASWVCSASCD